MEILLSMSMVGALQFEPLGFQIWFGRRLSILVVLGRTAFKGAISATTLCPFRLGFALEFVPRVACVIVCRARAGCVVV